MPEWQVGGDTAACEVPAELQRGMDALGMGWAAVAAAAYDIDEVDDLLDLDDADIKAITDNLRGFHKKKFKKMLKALTPAMVAEAKLVAAAKAEESKAVSPLPPTVAPVADSGSKEDNAEVAAAPRCEKQASSQASPRRSLARAGPADATFQPGLQRLFGHHSLDTAEHEAVQALDPIVLRKLNDINLKLTTDEQLRCLESCLRFGEAQAMKAVGKHLLLVIGNTGAGKSTMVNYLAGCTMQLIKRCDAGITTGNPKKKIIRTDPNSKQPELMKIGHSNQSATFVPSSADAPELGLTFADCPGFLDNRGAEINIANSCNIKFLIDVSASVRVVVLINYASIAADRGRGIKDLVQILRDMFGGRAERIIQHAQSLLVGVSRAPRNVDDDDMELSDFRDELTDSSGLPDDMAEVMSALTGSGRIFVSHPLDKGNDSWLKRPQLLDAIRALEPITEPSAIFSTVLTVSDEHALHTMVSEMAGRVDASLQELDYSGAAATLDSLDIVEKIDNVRVTRLLGDVTATVLMHVLSMEREANKLAMLEQFDAAERQLRHLERAASELGRHMPRGVDVASMCTAVRAFSAGRQRQRAAEEAMRRQFAEIGRKHTDLMVRLEQQQAGARAAFPPRVACGRYGTGSHTRAGDARTAPASAAPVRPLLPFIVLVDTTRLPPRPFSTARSRPTRRSSARTPRRSRR